MKIIPANMRDRSVSMMKAGVAAATLILTLGATASATDVTPDAQTKPQATPQTVKPRRWYEIGQASWYGLKFQGRKTAAGETYDMNGLTCAHRTLPLGSWIRVTNLKNRKSVFVRVNDRGPVPESRIIDLSYGAAQRVGLLGIGKVKLETLRKGDSEMENALLSQLKVPLVPVFGQ